MSLGTGGARPPGSHGLSLPALRRSWTRMEFDLRIILLSGLAGLPAFLLAMHLLWSGDLGASARWLATIGLLIAWTSLTALLRAALVLRRQRLGAIEADALLRRVLEELAVAVFAFDADEELRLLNRAAERLLGQRADDVLHRSAASLGLAGLLSGVAPRTPEVHLPGGRGRWELTWTMIRQDGAPLKLVVVSDVARASREEERQAWKRIIQVLSHEINNSLAPIKSIAGSLGTLTRRSPLPGDLDAELASGLKVIAGRADSLGRFMADYAKLARLPAPVLVPTSIEPLIRRSAALETRLAVEIREGPPARIMADPDQLDQLLINLVRNAADAALECGGGVTVRWRILNGTVVEVLVEDDGPGLQDAANLFVPFFTTKPGGSGIGLTLCRQIAEGHGGRVTLSNREPAGAVATLSLPLA